MNRRRNFSRRRTANGNYQRDPDTNRWVNDTEKSLEEEEETSLENQRREQLKKSVMETYKYKRGYNYPKEIQEVADFWRSLFYSKTILDNENTVSLQDQKDGTNELQKQILFELSEDGLTENASRNESFSFGNLKKEYQVLVFESYYGYKKGKCNTRYESKSMLEQMVIAKLIRTPREKERQKALNTNVTCWHCGNEDQKIQSIDEAFPCTKCDEDLWVGDGGFNKIGGIFK